MPASDGSASTSSENSFLDVLPGALAALAAGLGGKAIANAGGNPTTRDVPPQLSQLLDQSVQRQAYQNPLFQATTQGAYQMLPTFARQGTSLGGSLPNTVQPPSNGSGGGSDGGSGSGLDTAGTLGISSAAMSAILAAIKKLYPTLFPGGVGGSVKIPGDEFDPNKVYGDPPSDAPYFPGLGGGGNNDWGPNSYLKGNPNATLIDPLLGGAFGGGGTQWVDQSQGGPHGKTQAF